MTFGRQRVQQITARSSSEIGGAVQVLDESVSPTFEIDDGGVSSVVLPPTALACAIDPSSWDLDEGSYRAGLDVCGAFPLSVSS